MGVRFPGVGNSVIVTTPIPTSGEVVLATTQLLNPSLDFQQVLIWAYVGYSVGASATSTQFRIRRGATTAGVQVGLIQSVPTTGLPFQTFSIVYVDSPGAVAGIQYSLTAGQVAATGTAAINDLCIVAIAL